MNERGRADGRSRMTRLFIRLLNQAAHELHRTSIDSAHLHTLGSCEDKTKIRSRGDRLQWRGPVWCGSICEGQGFRVRLVQSSGGSIFIMPQV